MVTICPKVAHPSVKSKKKEIEGDVPSEATPTCLTINPAAIRAHQKSHHPRHIGRHGTPAQRAMIGHGRFDPLRAPRLIGAGDIPPGGVSEHV